MNTDSCSVREKSSPNICLYACVKAGLTSQKISDQSIAAAKKKQYQCGGSVSSFYEQFGFQSFYEEKERLFMPVADIRISFEDGIKNIH